MTVTSEVSRYTLCSEFGNISHICHPPSSRLELIAVTLANTTTHITYESLLYYRPCGVELQTGERIVFEYQTHEEHCNIIDERAPDYQLVSAQRQE